MFDDTGLSKITIAYFFSILIIGLFLLFREITSNNTQHSHYAPNSKASWADFTFFLWVLIILVFAIQNIWGLFSFRFPYPWNQISLGFAIQVTLLILIILSPRYYPRFFDFPVNATLSSHAQAIQQGVLAFFTGLPIVWLINLSWVWITKLWSQLGFPIDLEQQELVKLFAESHSPELLTTIILFGVIIAPITEEFIFRAGIYRFLKSKINKFLALTLSSLLFAWVHYNLLSFLPLFLLGLLLARSYEKTGNIITPIVFHGLFNANSLIILLINPQFYSVN